MDKIIDSFFKQCETGRVEVGNSYYNMNFSINSDKSPLVLHVKNKTIFYNYIKEFINLFNFENTDEIIKMLVYLFSNLTYSDTENVEEYVKRNISFVENKILKDCEFKFLENKITISILEAFQETPYCFKTTISLNNLSYELPTIYYGIDKGICYIYAIQDKNKDKTSSYSRKIKRILYRMNSGIKEDIEYQQYKNGLSDYYPENISDISPSAILVLSLFFQQLLENNITNIKVVPFLPIRYYSKEQAYKNKLEYLIKKNQLDKSQKEVLLNQFKTEHLRIQNNLTQKFIRNFFRLVYHFPNIEIVSLPFDVEEYMSIKLKPFAFDIFDTLGIDKLKK